MPYYSNDIINLLFIHIPKTGGSSVEQYFSTKYNIQLNMLYYHITAVSLIYYLL